MSDGQRYYLAPYNAEWLRQAREEIVRMQPAFGSCLVHAHHVGSTSIPGIMAKPVLDFVAEVTTLEELDGRRKEFEAIGYAWLGEYGIPRRRYIRPDDNRVHWHCFSAGTQAVHEHLAFRDYLRAHHHKARIYEAAKIAAMAKHRSGTASYHAEKSSVIKELLAEALAWHEAGRARSN